MYLASQVMRTSARFGGGDWRWRLTGASGAVVADCGGYRHEAQCLAAVSALRLEAGFAANFTETDPLPKRRKDTHAARSLLRERAARPLRLPQTAGLPITLSFLDFHQPPRPP